MGYVTRSHRLLIILLLVSVLVLATAAVLAALPALVRALPGRYAYYLPEPLQQWRQVPHPDLLPTPRITSTSTGEPAAYPTDGPTVSPTPTPWPTPTPSPTPTPLPALPLRHVLGGLRHEPQGWNNCGPTTLAMALSYWGRTETQYDLVTALKPDPEDKNVSPEEMAAAVRGLGLQALVRVGGSLERLKQLILAGYPVIVETWYVRDARDQLGHYRLIVGYDDTAQEFITYDSLHGPDLPIGYQELDELWRVFDRVYLVIYPLERENEIAALLGDEWDEQRAVAHALETARQEALDPSPTCVAYAACADAATFAWFNIGTNLTALGEYEQAAAAYDQARMLGLPWRMLWYQFGPYQAYYHVGRYEDVIALANATLQPVSNLEESYYWRGMAWAALGDAAGARADFQSALRYHPNWPPAVEALAELAP